MSMLISLAQLLVNIGSQQLNPGFLLLRKLNQ
jgi:hypothetical protein